jgi:hypothetical protein
VPQLARSCCAEEYSIVPEHWTLLCSEELDRLLQLRNSIAQEVSRIGSTVAETPGDPAIESRTVNHYCLIHSSDGGGGGAGGSANKAAASARAAMVARASAGLAGSRGAVVVTVPDQVTRHRRRARTAATARTAASAEAAALSTTAQTAAAVRAAAQTNQRRLCEQRWRGGRGGGDAPQAARADCGNRHANSVGCCISGSGGAFSCPGHNFD